MVILGAFDDTKLASLRKLILSTLFDYFFLALYVASLVLFMVNYGYRWEFQLPEWLFFLIIIIPLFLFIVLNFIFYFTQGQTIGSKMFGIKVVGRMGESPNFQNILQQRFLGIFFLPLAFLFLTVFAMVNFSFIRDIEPRSVSFLVSSGFVFIYILSVAVSQKIKVLSRNKKKICKYFWIKNDQEDVKEGLWKIMFVVAWVLLLFIFIWQVYEFNRFDITKPIYVDINQSKDIDYSDKKTLRKINKNYSKDKNFVYFNGDKVLDADVKSFVTFDDHYGCDKNGVFADKFFLKNVDKNSFKILNNNYFFDKNNVYKKSYDELKIIENIDLETFQKIDNFYAKDKNNIYDISNGKFNKIIGVDVGEFRSVGNGLAGDIKKIFYKGEWQENIEIDFNNIHWLKYNYFTDEHLLFWKNSERVIVVRGDFDVQTIKFLKKYYVKDRKKIYFIVLHDLLVAMKGVERETFLEVGGGYAKDKKDVYYKYIKIPNVDIETFELIEKGIAGFARDSNAVFWKGHSILGADPYSFQLLMNDVELTPDFGRNHYYTKDKNSVYSFSFYGFVGVLSWIDANTFKILDDIGFRIGDKNGIYRNFSIGERYMYEVEKCFKGKCDIQHDRNK